MFSARWMLALAALSGAGCEVLAGLDDYGALDVAPTTTSTVGTGGTGLAEGGGPSQGGGGAETGGGGTGGSPTGMGGAGGAGTGGAGTGGILTGGSGAGAGPGYPRAFVTQAAFMGNLGGVLGADQACTDAANAGMLGGGGWRAWLSSTGMSAINRLSDAGPWNSLDGSVVIATSLADFGDGPTNPLIEDEQGFNVSGRAWTGTMTSGLAAAENCNTWNTVSNTQQGIVGDIGATTGNVTDVDVRTCNIASHLYCFEQ